MLFCKEEDAEALLNQMKIMDPRMKKEGSKVVFQLKVNGVAFRLIPESTQVKNALKKPKEAHSKQRSAFGLRETGLQSSPIPLFGTQATQDANFEQANPPQRKERRVWTATDDVVLISAWLNTSKDPIVANE
ncbi:Tic22-like protein [Raphanus sativus]|nr:Tic22-like protein [Raphanus sativus]